MKLIANIKQTCGKRWIIEIRGLGLPFTIEQSYPTAKAAESDAHHRFPHPRYSLSTVTEIPWTPRTRNLK